MINVFFVWLVVFFFLFILSSLSVLLKYFYRLHRYIQFIWKESSRLYIAAPKEARFALLLITSHPFKSTWSLCCARNPHGILALHGFDLLLVGHVLMF